MVALPMAGDSTMEPLLFLNGLQSTPSDRKMVSGAANCDMRMVSLDEYLKPGAN